MRKEIGNGLRTIGNYKLGATIGEGCSGLIRLAESTVTGEKVAVKIVSRADVDDTRYMQEISNQQLLKHEHIIRIHEVLEHGGYYFIVMDFAPGGDLFDYIDRHVMLREGEIRRLFRQILAGVEHCHQCSVVHRDLKLENIFLDHKHDVKIGDFGLSATMHHGQPLTDVCGSPDYAAPELFEEDCKYEGPEVDVWSCGVVLYALLCNTLPNVCSIKSGRLSVPESVSSDAKDLLSQMLVVDPAMRISTSQIWQHAWLAK